MLVNDVGTEKPTYTSVALIRAARARDHRVLVFGVEDFVFEAGCVSVWAREAPEPHESAELFLAALSAQAPSRIGAGHLDVLLLRNNPADDLARPWAAQAGLIFGELAKASGVLVLNDPDGLAHAMTKLYLERFPAAIRPASVVTRHAGDVRAFAEAHGTVVVKPFNSSGGRGVFVVRAGETDNLNQILEAVGAYGYVVVQEYLAEAREGDVRIMLLNGRPLEIEGHVAAFRRTATNGDFRNNVTAGAAVNGVNLSASMRALAEAAGPRLIEDGIWLAGLDVVDHKVLEVNVFSPGGLLTPSAEFGVDFAAAVIEDLERKIAHAAGAHFDNRVLACR